MMPRKKGWTLSAIQATQERRKSEKVSEVLSSKIIAPRGCKVANSGISRLICTSASEQNAAYVLDWLERTGHLPPDATFEHSGDLTCKITWKTFEWSFLIQ